jgi:hypothetical protein
MEIWIAKATGQSRFFVEQYEEVNEQEEHDGQPDDRR